MQQTFWVGANVSPLIFSQINFFITHMVMLNFAYKPRLFHRYLQSTNQRCSGFDLSLGMLKTSLPTISALVQAVQKLGTFIELKSIRLSFKVNHFITILPALSANGLPTFKDFLPFPPCTLPQSYSYCECTV